MLHFDSSLPIVTRGSGVSRAPPHHTLPAFLNLNSMYSLKFQMAISTEWQKIMTFFS